MNRTGDGLLTTGLSANPSNPTAETTAARYIAAMADAVDGRYAGREGEVKMVVGSGTNGVYGHMAGLDIGGTTGTSGRTVTAHFGERLRVSPHVGAYANNRQEALVIKGTTFQTVCAIWPGIPILVDQSSRAPHGEIRLWAVLMHDFAILRTEGYTRHRFRTS